MYHIRYTAKNDKLFWKYFICTMYEVGMKPSLYIKPVVVDFGAVPKHVQ